MESFIRGVLKELKNSSNSISEYIFILPSKRAGSFLLKELSDLSENNIFAPDIYSIEEFTEEISHLETIDNTITLFEFYEIYKTNTQKKNLEDFETFVPWAQSLIHDFNEIDRYLIDYKPFFNYLSGIQDIKHWYLQEEKTDLIKNYLAFWKKIPQYYEALQSRLLDKKIGYQGLIYRQAASNINNYLSKAKQTHIFIGFNALNEAEQVIIQHLLENKKARIFWDLDETFYKDQVHAASMFVREYLKSWSYYQKNPLPNFSTNYSKHKNINIIGIPKNIGQAKYLGEILTGFDQEQLQKTAVVLGEEELLLPVLNSLPPEIAELNITMGFPVKNSPLNSFFEIVFQIHLKDQNSFYYKDVLSIINHPVINATLGEKGSSLAQKIHKENLVYLKYETILEHFGENQKPFIDACFRTKKEDISKFIEDIQQLIFGLKSYFKEEEDLLSLEFLYHFHLLFNKLATLNEKYPHLKTLKSLYDFYKELLSTEALDFQGRPFEGLQLMGMLESRTLDFENVIITSLNEGVLPAGKSDNSFIPYDLKKEYNLPTYKEKDAVYTYHFYRLLQRAKNVFLLYNTEAEGLNSGEKSRFLTQLEIEKNPIHNISSHIVSPKVPVQQKKLKEIVKTPEIIEKIRSLASSGFSPSALTTYIRNPLDFYTQYVLGVREQDEIEETVAFNTLGTVVHNCLETLYRPLESKYLSEEIIGDFLKNLEELVKAEFTKTYSKIPLEEGKNLLIFEVAKRYLYNFLNFELKRLKRGEKIRIIKVEGDYKVLIPIEKLPFSVYLRGKIDRLEEANGTLRITDYKTGKVEARNLRLEDWKEITQDYDKYSKCFQVLTYTSLIASEKDVTFPAEAGIISFKNLKSGFLKFAHEKDPHITKETLECFQEQLKSLIMEICNPEIPFKEKEIKKYYGSF